MVAIVAIPFLGEIGAADIAHLVPTRAGQLVAAGVLHEGHVAPGADTLDSQTHGLLYLGPQSDKRGFVADMYIGP